MNQFEWNCSEWRDLAYSDALNAAAQTNPKYKDWSCKLIHCSGFAEYLSPAIQEIVTRANLITVQRNVINQEILTAMQYFRGYGIPVVIDLDDAYQILPRCNPAIYFWHDNINNLQPEPLKMLEEGLRTCDGLTSPNRLILQDWQHIQPHTYYLPNFARRQWWTGLKSRAEMKAHYGLQDRIVIGWGGSVSHYDSFWGSGIREAATHICKHYPSVTWMICGNDSRLYDQLPVHRDNKYMQEGVPPEQWPQIIKTFDIGVAPLFGIYDQRRSWIKSLEYGLAAVPWVATTGEPYHDHLGLGIQLINSPVAWESAIESVINNLAKEQALAEQRVSLYQQWFVDNQLDRIAKTFNSIVSNRNIEYGRLPGIYYVSKGKN